MEIQSVVGKKDTFCLFLVCWWFCRNSGKGNNVVLKSVKNSIYWVWNVSKEREGKGEGAWSSIAIALTVPLLSSGVMDEREKLVFYWVIFYWDLNQKNVFSYRNLSILGERILTMNMDHTESNSSFSNAWRKFYVSLIRQRLRMTKNKLLKLRKF